MTTDTELWAPDEAAVDTGLQPPERPRDVDAERILVATAMQQPNVVDELGAEGFDPADITTDVYRWIWWAVEELRSAFQDGELRHLAVHRQLETWHADGRMPARVPTPEQLMDLYLAAHPGTAAWHAERITKKAVAARIVALGYDAIIKGSSPAFDENTDVADIQSSLDGAIRPADDDNLAAIGDLLLDSLERAVTPPTYEDRVPTGFNDVDSLLGGGFAPGQLVVIGARPAMGKSTVAADFARAAAIRYKIPTLFESLEMSGQELSDRILSAEARIAHHHLKQGAATDDDMVRAARRAPAIAEAPCGSTTGPCCPCLSSAGGCATWSARRACAWWSSTISSSCRRRRPRRGSRPSPRSPAISSSSPRTSGSPSSSCASSTADPNTGRRRSRRCPISASRGRSSRTPTSCSSFTARTPTRGTALEPARRT